MPGFMSARHVVIILASWFAAAFAVVATGTFARVPLPPPAFVAALSALAIFASLAIPSLRRWVMSVPMHALLLPHLVRFVGIAFLLLVSRDLLVREFVPIGWGDTIAAIGAVALLLTRPRSRWPLLAWNAFGLADMILLIITGIRLGLTAPEQFRLFRELPFGLLPTFFVPLIIATHVLIFVRALRRSDA